MTEQRRGFIVSGATGALGSAIAHKLLRAGHRVAVPYRDEAAWKKLEPSAHGSSLFGRRTHLVDYEDTRLFVEAAATWLGRLDGVAAVAGAFAGGASLHEAPLSEWGSMIDANLTTTYTLCRASLPQLQRGSSVVTIGSRAAEAGGSGAAAYAVSKVAVAALTRVLALENRERGIRFNCVLPATIDTPANRGAMPKADRAKWTPPEAIADVVAFLLSPESSPITGASIPVDHRG